MLFPFSVFARIFTDSVVTTHERPEDLLRDAETALRRAKTLGGGRSELFDPMLHTRAVNRLKLEEELREAIRLNQFRVFYQPVVEIKSRDVVGFEALVRWLHPEQGLISSHKFIEAAEDTGLLARIDQWVLSEACRQWKGWQQRNPSFKHLFVAANISRRHFADPQIVSQLRATLHEAGMPPACLQLEITEAVALANIEHSVDVLSQLRRLGVTIAIDDFGAGSSSIYQLRQLPIDVLKVDRSIVGNMTSDRATLDVVDLILTLAEKLNLSVVAEGVENSTQLDLLRALGCPLGQGYVFSKPVERELAEELLVKATAAKAAASTR